VYKLLIKPILFLFPPERAHSITLSLWKFVLSVPGIGYFAKRIYPVSAPQLRRTVFGLTFENPVGLAAGFDKNGQHIDIMQHLGFGFIEVGTVTPLAQAGNPQPRLFRLPKDNALINRMGFNNDGMDAFVQQLKNRPGHSKLIIGGNIGKNKVTPNEEAVSDYEKCFNSLFPYVDYFVVNVSSPNTPNLRALQDKEPLTALLSHLQTLNQAKTAPKPILLKIAPDLTNEQLDDIVEIVQTTAIDGVIATNTTISRDQLATDDSTIKEIGNGGLSGQPVKQRSTEVIRYLNEAFNDSVPIIGVGGIASAKDAMEKLEAGASLIQVYTGLIYEGPSLIRSINKTLAKA
jgi:dihydroorotate dehydrogenase